MKYIVITACLGLVGIGLYVATTREAHAPKYYAIEASTAVRPERFEAMKFQAVDVRQPASAK